MNSSISVVVFDVDGTLTEERSVWEYLHRRLGIWESQGLPNLISYMNGDIDYETFAHLDAAGYLGLHHQEMFNLIREIPRFDEIDLLMKRLRKLGLFIVLLSTGLDILVEDIPGADIRIANSLIFKDNICTGRAVIKVPIDGKYSVLKGLLSDLGYPFDSVVTIGDSKGDIEIMHASRLSIAVDPVDTSVIKAADYVLARHQLLRIPELIKRNRQKITTKK